MRRKQRELLLELRSKLVGQLHTQPFTIYNDDMMHIGFLGIMEESSPMSVVH